MLCFSYHFGLKAFYPSQKLANRLHEYHVPLPVESDWMYD